MAPKNKIRQMKYHKYIGVDGCKAGWFYVGISRYGECDFGVFKTLPQLWQANKKETLILVDIPIGLPSRENPTRQCDRLARKLLSPLEKVGRTGKYGLNWAEKWGTGNISPGKPMRR